MKKNTMTILIVVMIFLVFLIFIVGSLLTLKFFFFQYLKTTTEDTMKFIEECPLPSELDFEYEKLSEIAVVKKAPGKEKLQEMIDWCCEKYDSSRKICQLKNF